MRVFLFLLLFCVSSASFAQKLLFNLSYSYLQDQELDKAIQSYNFTRPFISEKQSLLIHGASGGITYLFKSDKKFRHGLNLSYTYYQSTANNQNFRNVLQLHQIMPAYVLYYGKKEETIGFFAQAKLQATLGALLRFQNGEAIVSDESTVKAFGLGGGLNAAAGYHLKISEKMRISPLISFTYCPYYYSPNMEVVLNQTMGMVNKNWSSFYNAQIGILLSFR